MAKGMDFAPDGSYYPVVYHNMFWVQSKAYLEINASVAALPLRLSYAPIASWKWAMQNSMEDQWATQQKTGLGTEKDADLMRETLLETSPWLLVVTFVVSLLHTLFDVLAFKNDIQVPYVWTDGQPAPSNPGMPTPSRLRCPHGTVTAISFFFSFGAPRRAWRA